MKTLKTFLLEKKGHESRASLVFHKIVSMLDHGHVDFSEKSVKFNIGALVKHSSYNHLNVFIRKGSAFGARLGIHKKDHSSVIVIETDELPSRDKIDTFLESTKVAKSFIAAVAKYLEKLHKEDPDAHKTSDEMESHTNTTERFEEIYNEIVKSVDEAITKFNANKAETGKVFDKFNIIKQETQKATHSLVEKEYFGSSESEFTKKYISENGTAAHFNKDMKNKLESRLKSLYMSKIKPLLGK